MTYDTVLLGSQCWLNKNLNIAPASADKACSGTKYCYDGDTTNCTYNGGLYKWEDMMCGSSSCNGTGEEQPKCSVPVQGICPNGWHIPSHFEWVQLEKEVCVSGTCNDFIFEEIQGEWEAFSVGSNEGSALAGGTSWLSGNLKTNYRFDETGFKALPAGRRAAASASYYGKTEYARFWTSTESTPDRAINHMIGYEDSKVRHAFYDTNAGFSVRCVMD